MTELFDPRAPENPNRRDMNEMTHVDATLGWIAGGFIAFMILMVLIWGNFNTTLDTARLNKQLTPVTETAPATKTAPPETTGQGRH